MIRNGCQSGREAAVDSLSRGCGLDATNRPICQNCPVGFNVKRCPARLTVIIRDAVLQCSQRKRCTTETIFLGDIANITTVYMLTEPFVMRRPFLKTWTAASWTAFTVFSSKRQFWELRHKLAHSLLLKGRAVNGYHLVNQCGDCAATIKSRPRFWGRRNRERLLVSRSVNCARLYPSGQVEKPPTPPREGRIRGRLACFLVLFSGLYREKAAHVLVQHFGKGSVDGLCVFV